MLLPSSFFNARILSNTMMAPAMMMMMMMLGLSTSLAPAGRASAQSHPGFNPQDRPIILAEVPRTATGTKQKTTVVTAGTVHYKRYVNPLFKYAVDYPADRFVHDKRQTITSEGINFDGTDGQCFLVIGAEIPQDPEDGHLLSLNEMYRDATGDDGEILSKAKGKDWFTVSRTGSAHDERFVYTKVIVGKGQKDSYVKKMFSLTYPANKARIFQPILRHMADSFQHLP